MNAVPSVKREHSMLLIVPHGRMPGMFAVRLLQLFPPSRVSWTTPSFVPAQISPFVIGDSAIANTTSPYSTPMLSGVRPPEIFCFDLSLRVRSGLMIVQLFPPSVVWCTNWLPTYTVLWSCGEIVSGKVHWKRNLTLSAGVPVVACGHTSTEWTLFVRTSNCVTIPPTEPLPEALDQTRFSSTVSGVAHPLSPPPTDRHCPRPIPGSLPNSSCFALLGPIADSPSCLLPYT